MTTAQDASEKADLAMYRALIQSAAWQWYVEHKLLPAFQFWDRSLDGMRQDTAWVQGQRTAYRSVIEMPYQPLGIDSPLMIRGVRAGEETSRALVPPVPSPAATSESLRPSRRPTRSSFVAE